eukprot:g4116.t1
MASHAHLLPPPVPLGGFPVPLDTVQHILKYVKFKERGKVATGISTHATAKGIREQLVSSFFHGGRDEFLCSIYRAFPPSDEKLREPTNDSPQAPRKHVGAGWFMLRQPKFESKRNDKDFVRKAVEHCGQALMFAGPEPTRDREVVLAAVKTCGEALMFADPELTKDREIVMAAVKQDGWALQYADPELRKDREIVMVAVKLDGWALEAAAPELKKDREIVLAAVKQNEEALEC